MAVAMAFSLVEKRVGKRAEERECWMASLKVDKTATLMAGR